MNKTVEEIKQKWEKNKAGFKKSKNEFAESMTDYFLADLSTLSDEQKGIIENAFDAGRDSIHFENDGSWWCDETAKETFLKSVSDEGQKWIDVNDKLPEYGKGVLLMISNGMMTIGYLKKATRTSIYRQWQLFGDLDVSLCINDNDEATHWQPLPQPPLKK